MKIITYNGFQNVQLPEREEDLQHLQPGLVLGQIEDFTMNVPLVYTNQKGPERLLMRYGNNNILRARLDQKDGSKIRFEENLLIAKGFSITPLREQPCEQVRWAIEQEIIKSHLPGIKLKNRMI